MTEVAIRRRRGGSSERSSGGAREPDPMEELDRIGEEDLCRLYVGPRRLNRMNAVIEELEEVCRDVVTVMPGCQP
jgi:hypothetical protein